MTCGSAQSVVAKMAAAASLVFCQKDGTAKWPQPPQANYKREMVPLT